jgi:glycine hydroxymethyltransferase
VATGIHPNPVPHADFVTTTTHKTLRGPRGGLIICREKYARDLDRVVFPGTQGGPLEHVIAAKAVCLKEAMEPEFKAYQQRVVKNARALAAGLTAEGFRIVTGGTDNHLFLMDLTTRGMTGRDAETALERAGMTVNKNAIPFDPNPPLKAGGIRVGSPAVTTRGMHEPEMAQIAKWMAAVMSNVADTLAQERVRKEVAALAAQFPLYPKRLAAAQAADQTARAEDLRRP